MAQALRTIGVLGLLATVLPINLVITTVAWATTIAGVASPTVTPASRRRTVLITGGKMTKSLAIARAMHLAGHRVVLCEAAKYRWTGHQFSRAVDVFCTTPDPSAPGYAHALRDIVLAEGVDVVIPVSSPASSIPEAAARVVLDEVCEVIHGDISTVRMLDDKDEFTATARALGLSVPDSCRITDPHGVETFDFPPGRTYILKRIAYNPVGRMDLTPLRRETPAENAAFARSLGITADDPWILQEFITGREYCTHGTVRAGRLQVYACCESSAFQINYEMVDKPAIRTWVERFLAATDLTGQASFDFIESADGTPYAIECNPRTHSAITMFYDHPDLAAAYVDNRSGTIEPTLTSRPTYWLYHEIWRLLTEPDRRARISTIMRGTDAIFTRWDPLPFLMVHHLQIPSLLVANLRGRRRWSRIDFNIGKLVEPGGD
ncbi:ATP-grasp enzyme [Williamsia sp. CHRR-6]|nr:ATP-grasp enzyme [Williamsia sp. CHRR-6]